MNKIIEKGISEIVGVFMDPIHRYTDLPLMGKNEMPADIAVDSLGDDQVSDLNRLKEWLHRKRTQVRQERERDERRQKKEDEAAKRKTEQPALFQF